MRLKQGRSYSVDREVHVADEKEPDVRLSAKATDANVPIEVKVAESWTLPELESALLISFAVSTCATGKAATASCCWCTKHRGGSRGKPRTG